MSKGSLRILVGWKGGTLAKTGVDESDRALFECSREEAVKGPRLGVDPGGLEHPKDESGFWGGVGDCRGDLCRVWQKVYSP